MTTDVQTIGAEEPVEEAIRRMDEGGFRHLPVVEGDRVLGLLSNRDIPVMELGRLAEELHERHLPAERAWQDSLLPGLPGREGARTGTVKWSSVA